MPSKTPSRLAFLCGAALLLSATPVLAEPRLDGVNVIVSPGHPFGAASTLRSLTLAKQAGARAIAIVSFLWQSTAASPNIVRGSDMSDAELRLAIRSARSLGLVSVVKPHVWVDGSWAGAVAMTSNADWIAWFENYRREVLRIGQIAAEEDAEILSLGTELEKTIDRPEWFGIIAALRRIYSGTLTYSAHNLEEADKVPFWTQLDTIAVTLYPPLGGDRDGELQKRTMVEIAQKLDALSASLGKPVIVSEVGLRSAQGAAAKPWESAEERSAQPDAQLQADILSKWLDALDRPSIRGVLIWRWFTDPGAGGPADTDFTIQGKDAERVIACRWARRCFP